MDEWLVLAGRAMYDGAQSVGELANENGHDVS